MKNQLIVKINDMQCSGSYVDVLGNWYADDGTNGEFTASGIDFSQGPVGTWEAMKTAFANEANAQTYPPSELTSANVLMR